MRMIGRNIRYKSPEVMLRLYKSMVHPHVEYCMVAWSPHYIKDKQLIEKIQRCIVAALIPKDDDLSRSKNHKWRDDAQLKLYSLTMGQTRLPS